MHVLVDRLSISYTDYKQTATLQTAGTVAIKPSAVFALFALFALFCDLPLGRKPWASETTRLLELAYFLDVLVIPLHMVHSVAPNYSLENTKS